MICGLGYNVCVNMTRNLSELEYWYTLAMHCRSRNMQTFVIRWCVRMDTNTDCVTLCQDKWSFHKESRKHVSVMKGDNEFNCCAVLHPKINHLILGALPQNYYSNSSFSFQKTSCSSSHLFKLHVTLAFCYSITRVSVFIILCTVKLKH